MTHKTNNPYLHRGNIPKSLNQTYHGNIGQVDILIVGGSALALKYNFRSTVDIDADIRFSGSIKGSINRVSKLYGIPDDWINQDFVKSYSYSRKIWESDIPITTLKSFMNIYVVSDLDQLCMKINSGRRNDERDTILLAYLVKSKGTHLNIVLENYKRLYGNVNIPSSSLNRLRVWFTVPGAIQTAVRVSKIRL